MFPELRSLLLSEMHPANEVVSVSNLNMNYQFTKTKASCGGYYRDKSSSTDIVQVFAYSLLIIPLLFITSRVSQQDVISWVQIFMRD